MYRFFLWKGIVVVLFCVASSGGVAAGADEEYTEIDVTINVYKNSGTTKAKAQEAVKKASEILKKAKIKLNVSDARTNENKTAGDDGSGGGTAEDGKFSDKEEDKVIAEGNKEVDGGKKGMKISFGKEFESGGPTNPGISIHKQPTVLVKDRNDAQKSGETIAHEMLHALTLAVTHTIDGTTSSDGHGHAPDKPGDSGRGNAMAPSDYRTGSAITPDQIKKINDDGYLDKWGKKVKQASPPAPGNKKEQQKGTKQDDRGETPLGYLDLDRTDLHSALNDNMLHGLVTLGGLFPAAGPVNANYSLWFDTDAVHTGPDRAIRLRVTGDASVSPLAINGELFDLTPGGGVTPLSNVQITSAIKAIDLDAPEVLAQHQLAFEVGKLPMGISSSLTPVPITIFSDEGSGLADSVALDLELDWWLRQPEMVLTQGQTQVGDLLQFTLEGLTPSSSFDFFVDEALLFSDTTNAFGQFAGGFNFPSVPLNDFYFLTAIDGLGNSAFNVINVVPEPSTLALLGAGALALLGMALRQRRK